MWKFKFYGFFKNLRFFEPFLLLIFLAWDVNLFQIGILIAIQEAIIFIFEVPSGILADNRGKKAELLICFIFYIISFIFYFMGPAYIMLIGGAIFFGLGEAFRSGTHKAMEMQWMEKEGLLEYKTFIYGTTRSYSLYGSAISSVLAIVFILNMPASRWIFIITIIPYVVDFILIASYPSYMNKHVSKGEKLSYIRELIDSLKNLKIIFTDKRLQKGIFSSSSYNATFKSLKDYIQPIMKILIVILLISFSLNPQNEELYLVFILGLIYAIFYLTSSISSKKAHKIQNKFKSSKSAMDWLFYFFAIIVLLQAFFIWYENPILIIILYLCIYVLYNARKPIGVNYLGDIMDKEQRATILSVEAQLKSILVMIFAPIFGYIAEYYSIAILFLSLSIFMFLLNFILLRGNHSTNVVIEQ